MHTSKILREGTELVLIDGQVFRRQRIIGVGLVQIIGILEVATDDIACR